MFRGSIKYHLKCSLPSIIILFSMILFASISSPYFLKPGNIGNILVQATPLAITALGQSFVMLSGNMDLSLGSIVSLSTVVIALISNTFVGSGLVAVLLALGIGLISGLCNGIGVVKLNIPPMIMSFCIMTILNGVAVTLMPGSGGSVPSNIALFITSSYGVFSIMALIMIILYIIAFIISFYTKIGRNIYIVGNNSKNATDTGINSGLTKIVAYAIAGVLAAFSGMLLCYRMFSGNATIGDSYSMDSVAAVVLGGTSLAGGSGSVVGTFAGAMVLSIIGNLLNMLNISASYQYIIKGLILVSSILFFQLRRRR